MIDIEGKEYLSSTHAADLTGYTNDYIGQLCRAQKVRGVIVGRTHFVEKESMLAYAKENHSTDKILFTQKKNMASKSRDAVKNHTRVSISRNLIFGMCIMFGSYMIFFPQHIRNVVVVIQKGVIAEADVSTPLFLDEEESSQLSGVVGVWVKYAMKQTEVFLGSISHAISLAFGNVQTIKKSMRASAGSVPKDNWGGQISLVVYRVIDAIGRGAYGVVSRSLAFTVGIFSPVNPVAQTNQDMMVVVPAAVSQTENEDLKNRIRSSFSDEINVDVGPDGSGVITPVFKSGKKDTYMYVMVPVGE